MDTEAMGLFLRQVSAAHPNERSAALGRPIRVSLKLCSLALDGKAQLENWNNRKED